MTHADGSKGWRAPLNHLLREPPGNPKGQHTTNSAYGIERNPWTSRDDVEAALFFRGAIVSAYASIETQLGTLALRFSLVPECQALRSRFPFAVDRRIAFLRSAFGTASFAQYSSWANLYLARFEQVAKLRHIAAHAQMRVLTGWLVEFNDYPMSDSEAVTRRTEKMTLGQLEAEARRAASLSRLGQRLLSKLDASGRLPSLPER